MTTPAFRVVLASTGHVVQCDCGWYAPSYDHDPAALHDAHLAESHATPDDDEEGT